MDKNDGNLLISVLSFLTMVIGAFLSYKFHLPIVCLILFIFGSIVFGGILAWDLIKIFKRGHKK